MPSEPKVKRVKIATEKNTIIKLAAPEQEEIPVEEQDELDPAQFLEIFDSASSSDEDDGIPLDKLPAAPKPSKKESRKHDKDAEENDEPGVLYIGHIPHGFYEPQMRAYFSQFGTITPGRLRLSRNKQTGASKHYAFIQSESGAVADIVQRTMDKYLLFGHILAVKRLSAERVHENMWIGADKRFKKIPWNRLEGKGLSAPRSREVWDKRIAREEARREKKKKVIEDYGYEFEIPSLKKTANVPSRTEREKLENEKPTELLEAPEDKEMPEKTNKRKSTSETTVEQNGQVEESAPQPVKKRSKRKGKAVKS